MKTSNHLSQLSPSKGNATRPLVSICIPVFNAEKYISECLESLVNQTLKDIEIICVDDGSTDHSLEILKNYQKRHHNITVIHQENQGLGGARNTGIKNARGKYIGFVDADDYVDKTMYKVLYHIAEKNHAEIAMCNLAFEPEVKTKKHLWYKPYKGKIDGEFLDRNIQPWNKIILRELIDRVDFEFFPKNGDDMLIILMVNAKKIVSTNEKYYHYRIGHNTMSNTFKVESFINFLKCTEAQINEIKKTDKYEQLKEYLDYRMIYVLLQTMAVAAAKHDKQTFSGCKKRLKQYDFRHNYFTKKLLKKEFSSIEYIGMTVILPVNYYFSSLLLGPKLKGWK